MKRACICAQMREAQLSGFGGPADARRKGVGCEDKPMRRAQAARLFVEKTRDNWFDG